MAVIDVVAPMAGAIKEILVSVGSAVSVGQEIFIMESMKMEIPVEATDPGTVTEIAVAVDDLVEEGQPLLRLTS